MLWNNKSGTGTQVTGVKLLKVKGPRSTEESRSNNHLKTFNIGVIITISDKEMFCGGYSLHFKNKCNGTHRKPLALFRMLDI
jgi:hypothetical protein